MQRVRAGLTGLAAIFLMVLIAAAGSKPARPPAASGVPVETLAVLGVAPGSSGPSAGDVERQAATPQKPKPAQRRPSTT